MRELLRWCPWLFLVAGCALWVRGVPPPLPSLLCLVCSFGCFLNWMWDRPLGYFGYNVAKLCEPTITRVRRWWSK